MKKYKYTKAFIFERKRYYVRGDTAQECYKNMILKQRDLEEGRVVISSNMPVKLWTEKAISTYKVNVSDNVLADMKLRINKHIISEIGNMPLKSVTPLHCQQIMNAQQDMSASHINKLYQELQFIFDTAVRNHLISESPARDIVRPKGSKGTRRSLTENELYHFTKLCENTDKYILFELMLYCGCRPSEAMNCLKNDFTTVDGIKMLHIRGTKSTSADRYVPFPAFLSAKIRKLSPFDFIARNEANRRHTEASYNRLVARLRREMNISMGCRIYRNALVPPLPLADDFVPYNFRHTYCTNLAKSGVDIRTAQRLMGHASIQMTANVYTHVDMSDIKKAAAQIEEYRKSI